MLLLDFANGVKWTLQLTGLLWFGWPLWIDVPTDGEALPRGRSTSPQRGLQSLAVRLQLVILPRADARESFANSLTRLFDI
jgi:hypothetical protein